MGQPGDDDLQSQLGEVVDRHGDEVAEELTKTIRTTRRLTVGAFVVVGLAFVAMLALIVWFATTQF
jgi:hypothetical protein